MNANAPEGVQVAMIQEAGARISQSVNFAAGGTYAITFWAAQRVNWTEGNQDFAVLLDGNTVGTFNPVGGPDYAAFSTGVFTVTAGAHTIEFLGLDTGGGDRTAFIDDVAIVSDPPATPIVPDGGFESETPGTDGTSTDPIDGPWTYTGTAGVTGNNTAFTAQNPDAPEGRQAAFLQGTGTIAQSVTVPRQTARTPSRSTPPSASPGRRGCRTST